MPFPRYQFTYNREDEKVFKDEADHLAKWVSNERHNFFEQKIADLNCELQRLRRACAFLLLKRAIEQNKVHDTLKAEK